ncbi:quinohemoprotein amine dehydrogenase maturation protein [Aliarcobacter butzleri]|uniref:quinohemoprotein amine dehydrogenase maturation protein n=1 Tax=Aliarcobacter butzleri TaxID=28197 RepID=UPI001EDC2187|nr:quinohemoprotein amine dehydrogenase maturation protein [Aliarcobacter butzleri]MCG3655792.1 quinohemoprotein amine dehydrogenase maturation protein [Aliarcobacter butzleri]MDK2051190.1 quinohemoprotein amine dehydrogenase maturation protein [Aliarcobacter butzleri]
MSSNELKVNRQNFRIVKKDSENLLFHVPSSSLFDIDKNSQNLLNKLNKKESKNTDFSIDELEELEKLNIIGVLEEQKYIEVKNFPATTLILNVASGCNLSCTYCYKADLATLKNSGNMTYETAISAIEHLYNGASNQKIFNITFFGGEPLSNFSLIKKVTIFAITFFKEKNAIVDFTMTTNATLLTKEIIEFLKTYKFGITISMDGPAYIHNKTRLTNAGNGSYETVRKKVELLLSLHKDRPIGARVTLTRGVTQIEEIWEHLFNELKFSEVGFAPATASDNAVFNLSEVELIKVFEGFKTMGEKYIDSALNGEFNGFSNLHRLIGDIHAGRKKKLPCGAGVGLLSVSYEGNFDLCHRFTGSDFMNFGNVKTGLDKPKLSNFIETRLNKNDGDCSTCHIRNLCAGGCYHESFIRYNDPTKAVLHYCDIMRDWIDFGLYAYSKIRKNNPEFFDLYFKEEKGDVNGLI